MDDIINVLRQEKIRCTPYALAVANGQAALSGADLRGKARRYGASYFATRHKVVKALLKHCDVTLRKNCRNGKIELDWGDGSNPLAIPDNAELSQCALGVCWKY